MNDQSSYGTFRARVIRLPAWQIAVIGALAAALVVTLAIVATGVFLLVFPVMIALDWFYRWRRGKAPGAARATPRDSGKVITTEYEVLPPERSSADERR